MGSPGRDAAVISVKEAANASERVEAKLQPVDVERTEEPFRISPAMLALCLVNLNDGYQMNVIWAWVPWMVDRFVPEAHHDIATYVGLFASSFFLSQFFSAFLWGWFSDVYGRRPALVMGLFGTGIATIVLGLAQSYPVAVFARLIGGALNGNIGVTKVMVSEINPQQHQAQAMALLSFNWGLASTIAPLVSGFLADPVAQYGWDSPLLAQYPYLLPCLSAAILSFSAFGLSILFLPESPKWLALQGLPPSPSLYKQGRWCCGSARATDWTRNACCPLRQGRGYQRMERSRDGGGGGGGGEALPTVATSHSEAELTSPQHSKGVSHGGALLDRDSPLHMTVSGVFSDEQDASQPATVSSVARASHVELADEVIQPSSMTSHPAEPAELPATGKATDASSGEDPVTPAIRETHVSVVGAASDGAGWDRLSIRSPRAGAELDDDDAAEASGIHAMLPSQQHSVRGSPRTPITQSPRPLTGRVTTPQPITIRTTGVTDDALVQLLPSGASPDIHDRVADQGTTRVEESRLLAASGASDHDSASDASDPTGASDSLASAIPSRTPTITPTLPPPPQNRFRQLYIACCTADSPLRAPAVARSIAIYSILSFPTIMFDELFPMIAKLAPSEGGLGFGQQQVGLAITVQGVTLIIFQLFFFHRLARWFGQLRMFHIMTIGIGLMFAVTPITSVFAQNDMQVLLWLSLCLLLVVKCVTLGTLFSLTSVFINNAARGQQLGVVNGVSQSLVALTRTVGPTFTGLILAGCLQLPGWYLHVFPVFLIMAAGAWILRLVAIRLPEWVEDRAVVSPSNNPMPTSHE